MEVDINYILGKRSNKIVFRNNVDFQISILILLKFILTRKRNKMICIYVLYIEAAESSGRGIDLKPNIRIWPPKPDITENNENQSKAVEESSYHEYKEWHGNLIDSRGN